MKQLTNKINIYNHKTSLDNNVKNSMKKSLATSEDVFKPNAMYIKLNKISNSKENFIYLMNQKMANLRSFDKKLKIKKEKKEKNSFEFESKDKISTNNLTEILNNNSNMNNIENRNNDVNFINFKANGININSNKNLKPSTSMNENLINNNNNSKKIMANLNIKNIQSINFNKNMEKKTKNNHKMKHIKVNTHYKKSLHFNHINSIKKSINLNLNSNSYIKNKNITVRKLSNLTEDSRLSIGIGGLLPLKSKTQNYFILKTNNNFYSNKKSPKEKKFNDLFNNSSENRKTTNEFLSSKKKLFIGSHNNIQKKCKLNTINMKHKRNSNGLKNIDLGKSSYLVLNKISGKNLIKTASSKNKNIKKLMNRNKIINMNNIKEIDINDNNHTITQENDKNQDILYIERTEINEKNAEEKELDKIGYKTDIKEKKLKFIMTSNLIISEKIGKNNINLNGIKSSKNQGKTIILNKNDLIILKKKKNSNKNVNKLNISRKKKLNLELNLNEKNNDNHNQYNIPIINKVHIFEIGKNKISKNNNLNTSDDKIKENKNNFLQNLILNNSDKKDNNDKINISKLSPKKKESANYINNNVQNITKKIQENKLKYFNHLKNYNTTPLDQKHNLKGNYSSSNIKNSNKINEINKSVKNIRNKLNKKEKELNDETPILSNTARLTERMFNAKLNLFEKIKNMKTDYNLKKNKNIIDDNSSEYSEIIYQEISISSNNKRNTIKNSIKYIIFLDQNCNEKIFDFLEINTINILCTINKRCFNIFKPIINKKIKEKILSYYALFPNKYFNKVKIFLMSYSPLSKLSPLLLHKKYVDLLLQNNQRYDQEIQKDLTRTVPDDSSFKYGNPNYNKLYHLLTVYSLYNTKIGYAQGINFIAANIIKLMEKEKEENILMFLDGFLQKFDFAKLLGNKNGNFLQKNLDELSSYLDKYCPEISKFFINANICHEIFSTNWILTLFSNSMNNKYLFIIWDFLIIFGNNFFMCFVICVLNLFKNEILNEKQSNITFFMRNILRNQKFEENFNLIVDKTIDFMNKNYKL